MTDPDRDRDEDTPQDRPDESAEEPIDRDELNEAMPEDEGVPEDPPAGDPTPEVPEDMAIHLGALPDDETPLDEAPPEEAVAALAEHFGRNEPEVEPAEVNGEAAARLAEHFGRGETPADAEAPEVEADASVLAEHFGSTPEETDGSAPAEPIVVGPHRHSFAKVMLWSLPTLVIGITLVLFYKGYITPSKWIAEYKARNSGEAGAVEAFGSIVKTQGWDAIRGICRSEPAWYDFSLEHVDGQLAPGETVTFRVLLTNAGDKNIWIAGDSFYDLYLRGADGESFEDLPEYALSWVPDEPGETPTVELGRKRFRVIVRGQTVKGRTCQAVVTEPGKLVIRIKQHRHVPDPEAAGQWDYEEDFVERTLTLGK